MGMLSRGVWSTLCLSLMLPLVAPPASAQILGGTGQLFGREKCRVQRCGRDRDEETADVILNCDGSWRAVVDGLVYTGTSALIGGSGRKFDLLFDESSISLFTTILQGFATGLCGISIASTVEEKRKFVLKVNKRRTKAAVILKYRFEGTGGGRSRHPFGQKRHSSRVQQLP